MNTSFLASLGVADPAYQPGQMQPYVSPLAQLSQHVAQTTGVQPQQATMPEAAPTAQQPEAGTSAVAQLAPQMSMEYARPVPQQEDGPSFGETALNFVFGGPKAVAQLQEKYKAQEQQRNIIALADQIGGTAGALLKTSPTPEMLNVVAQSALSRKETQPQSDIGKIEADRMAGFITPDQARARIEKETSFGNKAPSGYRFTETGDLEPVPGGPSDIKRQTQFANDQNGVNAAIAANQKQLEIIKQLRAKPGLEGNFGLRGAIPNMPGTEAADAAELKKQLDANSFISSINALKTASQTGASGLGSLTEREGDKIQSAAAALGKEQSYDSFLNNLAAYESELKASNDRLLAGFKNIYKDMAGNFAPASPTAAAAAPSARPRITAEQARAELERRKAKNGN